MNLQLKSLGLFSHNHHCRHRHRRMSEADSASLQAFRSQVSENLNRVLESLKLGSEFLSLTWMHQCFQMLPIINNAFAKLMMEIDYPLSNWECGSVDELLHYTMNVLDLLNMIGSSLSHANQARISLSRALNLIESSPALAVERMREIKKHDSIHEFKLSEGVVERNGKGKELIFHEAMLVLKSSGIWVCGVVLLGLKSDVNPIMKMMNGGVFVDSSLMALDSIFRKKLVEKRGIVKKVEGVNESVRLILLSGIGDSDAGMELKRRLEVIESGLKGLQEQEECLFGTLMAARNEVLETLRRNNH